MAKDVRATMIKSAAELLSRNGLEGTSFADVLAATGAPRGSLYHHFPGGKDELIAEATRYAGGLIPRWLDTVGTDDPVAVIAAFVDLWRRLHHSAEPPPGCAIAAVTVAAPFDSGLTMVAGEVFTSWTSALAARFQLGGLGAAAAVDLATTTIASVEGAVIMSRAVRDAGPLDAVGRQLEHLARQRVAGD